MVVHALVEGQLDSHVANRLIQFAGLSAGSTYGLQGFGYIKTKVRLFNQSAQGIFYLALVDFMDTGLSCPAEVVSSWIPNRRSEMIFRVVVNELESWLLADRENLARFLGIDINKIPNDPESILDPKLEIVNLARGSKNSTVRSALVPRKGSTAQVGKLYNSEMMDFIDKRWNIVAARKNAPSLDRCLVRLTELKKQEGF